MGNNNLFQGGLQSLGSNQSLVNTGLWHGRGHRFESTSLPITDDQSRTTISGAKSNRVVSN